jgi:hypothetical protein
VRVAEELTHDETSARLEHAPEFPQRGALIWDLAEDSNKQASIEGRVGIWEVARVPLRRDEVPLAPRTCPSHGVVEHLLLKIEDVELTVRRDGLRDAEAVVARSRPNLQHALPRERREHFAEP